MTSTDLDLHQDNAPAVRPQGVIVDMGASVSATVARWEEDLQRCAGMAHRMVRTEVTPASYWPLPAGVALDQMPNQNPRRRHRNETVEEYAERLAVATETVAGTIYAGAQMGLPSWNVALQNIDYIRGRQSMRSRLIESLYVAAGHEFELIERSPTRAAARFRRSGSDRWDEMEFTFDRAVTEGLVKGMGPNKTNSRGSDQYLLRPTTMLWWRLMSDAVSALAPEVLLGMAVAEEMEQEPPEITATVSDLPGSSSERLAAVLASRPEPVSPESDQAPRDQRWLAEHPGEMGPQGFTPAAPPEEEPSRPRNNATDPHGPPEVTPPERALPPAPLGNRGWAILQGRFNEIGVTGKGMQEERRRILGHLMHRQITSAADLTAEEGRWLADNLAGPAGQRICATVLERPDLLPDEDRRAAQPDPIVAQGLPAALGAPVEDLPDPTDRPLPDPTDGADPWADAAVQDPPTEPEGWNRP